MSTSITSATGQLLGNGRNRPLRPLHRNPLRQHPRQDAAANLVNGIPDVMEIWNLVFIQYNRNPDKSLTPLPAKHVDTGMGFERITEVLQGKTSNYDTDIFTPIFDAIQKVTGAPPYTGKLDDLKDTAYRVIADHIRTLTFAITDGAVPSNIGRGYVLRSVLRRAERYGWQQFGTTRPFLHMMVPTVVASFSGIFPELAQKTAEVQRTIEAEEIQFLRTLERGIEEFNLAAAEAISKALANSRGWKEGTITLGHLEGERSGKGLPQFQFHLLNDKGQPDSEIVDLPETADEQRQFFRNECKVTPRIPGKKAIRLAYNVWVFHRYHRADGTRIWSHGGSKRVR